MKNRQATARARCGNIGTPRQLNELVQFDRNEPIISLCGECLHLLKYADASTWKWFREYRDRLIKMKTPARLISRQPDADWKKGMIPVRTVLSVTRRYRIECQQSLVGLGLGDIEHKDGHGGLRRRLQAQMAVDENRLDCYNRGRTQPRQKETPTYSGSIKKFSSRL
jgi:hypothetical protein